MKDLQLPVHQLCGVRSKPTDSVRQVPEAAESEPDGGGAVGARGEGQGGAGKVRRGSGYERRRRD